jgi:branched-chain amino acid transport system permease protein
MTAPNHGLATNTSRALRPWQRFVQFQQRYPHYLLLLLISLVPLAFMNFGVWVMLTISGAAMGLLIFIMASGMTLTFGLMGVLNLAHGAFISLGAYLGMAVLAFFAGAAAAPSIVNNLGAVLPALLVALLVAGVLGLVFERVIIRPVYDNHLKQILVTVGGAIVIEQIIHVIWGASPVAVTRPQALSGAIIFGDIVIERYRLLAVLIGLAIYWAMIRIINRTKVGILIRAGVESTEMVEVHGYRIRLLFMAVFAAGSALAAFGGVLWGMYQELITAHIGAQLMVMVIVVIIIGGLGSITGCFFAAICVGLINLYTGYLVPPVSGVAAVGLLVGVLMWRPQGLIPVIKA